MTDATRVIAPRDAGDDLQNFEAEVMALVRSIKQQYWELSWQLVQLWSREKAVSLGEEVLQRESAGLESGHGTTADVAVASRDSEDLRNQHVKANVDVIAAERQPSSTSSACRRSPAVESFPSRS